MRSILRSALFALPLASVTPLAASPVALAESSETLSSAIDSRAVFALHLDAGDGPEGRAVGASIELRLLQAVGGMAGVRWTQRGPEAVARLGIGVLDVDYVQLVPFLEASAGAGPGVRRAAGASLALPLFARWSPAKLEDTLLTLEATESVPFGRSLGAPTVTIGIERFVW